MPHAQIDFRLIYYVAYDLNHKSQLELNFTQVKLFELLKLAALVMVPSPPSSLHPFLVWFSWVEAIQVVRQKQFTNFMHAKTRERRERKEEAGRAEGDARPTQVGWGMSDFPLPPFREICNGRKSIVSGAKIESMCTTLYSPIEIVDEVHHRVRESTEAVLQMGTRFRMIMLMRFETG